MPQLSLYVDKDTLNRITQAAKAENLSVSRYVVQKINESMDDSWPKNFESLFGAIKFETFRGIETLSNEDDIPREQL